MQSHELKRYSIRIRGHLGAASLAAFPEMVSQRRGPDSVLTGVLPDQPALFGVLREIESLALELIELRCIDHANHLNLVRHDHHAGLYPSGMNSATIRDQLADHLITPKNAALVLIDYQPSQFSTVRSMDPGLLLKNIVSTVKTERPSDSPSFTLQ